MTRWAGLACLVLILLSGAILRLLPTGDAFWLDESVSFRRAQLDSGRLLDEVKTYDAHPPLYYLTLKYWLTPGRLLLFSTWHENPPFWQWYARALSGLASCASLVISLFLFKRLLGKPWGLAAGWILALSSFEIYFAHEARHYAFSTLWTLVAVDRFLAMKQEIRPRDLVIFFIVSIFAFYTFYYSVFPLIWLWGALYVRIVRKRKWSRLVIAGPVVVGLLCGLWLPVILDRIKIYQEIGPIGGSLHVGFADLANACTVMMTGILPGLKDASRVLWLIALAPLCPSLFCLRAFHIRHVWGMLLVSFACVMILPFKGHQFEAKHLVFCAPLLILLGFAWIEKVNHTLLRRSLGTMLVCGLAFCHLAGLEYYLSASYVKENWPGVSQAIEADLEQDDAIVLSPGYIQYPFDLYFKGNKKTYIRVGTETTVESLRRATRQAQIVWLVQDESPVAVYWDAPHDWLADWQLDEERSRIFPGACGVLYLYRYERPPLTSH